MKKLFLLITLFFLIFPFTCFSGGPIGGGPIGEGGIDIAAPGPITTFQLDHNTETLTDDKTLIITDKTVQFLDPNGADRNIILSAEAFSTNLVFTIVNISDGADEDLVIRDDTPTTLITIGPGQGVRVSCDGTDWKVWFDSGVKFDGVANSTIFPSENDAVTPTIAFGDGDTGFYETIDSQIAIAINGVKAQTITTSNFGWLATGRPTLRGLNPSSTQPNILPDYNDLDTGLGRASANRPAIISGGIPSQVWGTVVTLSTAQVNALQATPITIVAAQGANTWIELVTAVITYDYATAAFTVAADEDLVIEYGDGTDATASIETTGFLDQVDDEIRYYPFVLAAGADPEATINQVLRIKNTGAGEIANGGGEVDIRVVYRVYATGF